MLELDAVSVFAVNSCSMVEFARDIS